MWNYGSCCYLLVEKPAAIRLQIFTKVGFKFRKTRSQRLYQVNRPGYREAPKHGGTVHCSFPKISQIGIKAQNINLIFDSTIVQGRMSVPVDIGHRSVAPRPLALAFQNVGSGQRCSGMLVVYSVVAMIPTRPYLL